jgi:hypothetical protein
VPGGVEQDDAGRCGRYGAAAGGVSQSRPHERTGDRRVLGGRGTVVAGERRVIADWIVDGQLDGGSASSGVWSIRSRSTERSSQPATLPAISKSFRRAT